MEISEEFLREVGLNAMGEAEKKAFLEFVQEEVEVRVGEEIAEGLSEEKIREFDNAESDEAAREWLEKNKPNYREIVKGVIEGMKEEIRKNKEKII